MDPSVDLSAHVDAFIAEILKAQAATLEYELATITMDHIRAATQDIQARGLTTVVVHPDTRVADSAFGGGVRIRHSRLVEPGVAYIIDETVIEALFNPISRVAI